MVRVDRWCLIALVAVALVVAVAVAEEEDEEHAEEAVVKQLSLRERLRQKIKESMLDRHQKADKSEEEQTGFDQAVLMGGDTDERTIHDMTEEEQHAKLFLLFQNKMDANSDG